MVLLVTAACKVYLFYFTTYCKLTLYRLRVNLHVNIARSKVRQHGLPLLVWTLSGYLGNPQRALRLVPEQHEQWAQLMDRARTGCEYQYMWPTVPWDQLIQRQRLDGQRTTYHVLLQLCRCSELPDEFPFWSWYNKKYSIQIESESLLISKHKLKAIDLVNI